MGPFRRASARRCAAFVRKRIAFGELAPDLAEAGQIVRAENVYAIANGYAPVGKAQRLTPELSGIVGAGAFVGSDGTASLIAGDSAELYRFSSGAWASLIDEVPATRWRFAQFGDNVIAVRGAGPVRYDLIAGTAELLDGSPPAADMVATVRDFVVLAGDPDAILTVYWSGFNNSEQWTAGVNQSDFQPLADGGEIMGLAGGEYGIVLQRGAIKRMTYEGDPIIFRFDEISSNVGCMAKGSVVQAGRLVFFLSERGFMLCDGNEARPIGSEKIDRTFFATYSRQEIEEGIYAAVDPRRYIVAWSMPGNPGDVWCYNWLLDRWTTIRMSLRGVFQGFTANVALDAIDALYPDGVDTIPLSLDDPLFSGGNPLFLVADTEGALQTLTGTPMAAAIERADDELEAERTRVRTVRPITDADEMTIHLDGRARAGAGAVVRTSGMMRSNGDVHIRFNARHFRMTFEMPEQSWTYLRGADVDYESGGRK